MFPNDAKTIFLDDHTSQTGTILSSKTYDRTILYTRIACDSGNDQRILIGNSATHSNNDVQDSERATGNSSDVFMIRTLPANQILTYRKSASGNNCNFTIVYTDYNLADYGSGYPAYFSGDGLFTSFLLLIGLLLAIISFVWLGVRSVRTHKKYTGVNEWEGKQDYDI
jgi:hypothetical protein